MNLEQKILRLYPLTVICDRYSGVYSGGKYLAFNNSFDEIPFEICSGDANCMIFWAEENKYPVYTIGKGDTPLEALEDLIKKLEGEIR